MSLAEELLLLAYDDAGAATLSRPSLEYGLAGALLMELMLASRLEVRDERVVASDTSVTGTPLVDDALARIVAEPTVRTAREWLTQLSPGLRDRVLDQLIGAGVLRREDGRAEPAAETQVRRQLRYALDSTGPVDPRTAALCALVRAVRLEDSVFPDLPKKDVRARLATIAVEHWPADAVRGAIKAVEAAMGVSITVTAAT